MQDDKLVYKVVIWLFFCVVILWKNGFVIWLDDQMDYLLATPVYILYLYFRL